MFREGGMAMFDLALAALLALLVGLALYRTTVPRRVFCARHQWPYLINFTMICLLLMLLAIQLASCIRMPH
jgi:hypothetical protein